MRRQAILLAAALAMAPLGARAADLVVWWEKGFYPQADEAVAEIVAAFEQDTGKQVDLVQPAQDEVFQKAQAALAARQPPDFLFGTLSEGWAPQWAYEDRLVDLRGALGGVLDLFDPDMIEGAILLNGSTGRRSLYALPMGPGVQPHSCLEQPPEARRLYPGRYSEGVARLLVFLVRRRTAGATQGSGPR